MRVHILGTGAAEGFPALFCDCLTCRRARAAGGKDIRSRVCLRIDEDILIDMPPDLLAQTHQAGFSLASIRHVLITHTHRDHFTPSELMWRDEPFAAWQEPHTLDIYGPPHVGEMLRRAFDDDPADHDIHYHTVRPFAPFGAGDFKVTAVEANHARDRGTVNYVLSRGDRNLLLAFDTGWYAEQSWVALDAFKFDLVVMECTNGLADDPDAEHLSVAGVKRMHGELTRRGCVDSNTRFITVHFSHNGGLLHHELEQQLAPLRIEVGYDGLIVEVSEQTS